MRRDFRKPIDKGLKSLAISQLGTEMTEKQMTLLKSEIGESIRDWMPLMGEVSYLAFVEYVRSEYKTLPFSGGILEQPLWVLRDFALYRNIMDFHYLQEKLRKER